MHLAWGEAEETFRAELLAFLEEHAPPEARVRRDFAGDVRSGGDGSLIPQWARDWQATLFDHGWMIPGYPPELGGRNATPVQTLVYLEEMARLGVPRSVHFPGYAIVAPTLLEFGTPSQQALAPAAIRGDTVWCIGMSEPNAGSDLAGPADPRGARRRQLRHQRAEGVDVVRDGCRSCAAATCGRTRTRRSTRASHCSSWT